MRHQQDLRGRRLAILILPTTSWPRHRPHAPLIAAAIAALGPGAVGEFVLPAG